jgi:hypothetical protein
MIMPRRTVFSASGQGLQVNTPWGSTDMPAYIHNHDVEPEFIVCPSCVGLAMYVKDVAPHWSMAKIDFTFECSVCGAEIRQTVIKPELLN